MCEHRNEAKRMVVVVWTDLGFTARLGMMSIRAKKRAPTDRTEWGTQCLLNFYQPEQP